MFGGHGTGGWLSRYDIYYNDCIILDRGENFHYTYQWIYHNCCIINQYNCCPCVNLLC